MASPARGRAGRMDEGEAGYLQWYYFGHFVGNINARRRSPMVLTSFGKSTLMQQA